MDEVCVLPPKPGRIAKSWSSIRSSCSDLISRDLVLSSFFILRSTRLRTNNSLHKNSASIFLFPTQTHTWNRADIWSRELVMVNWTFSARIKSRGLGLMRFLLLSLYWRWFYTVGTGLKILCALSCVFLVNCTWLFLFFCTKRPICLCCLPKKSSWSD